MRYQSLDAMRGVFALMIVLLHLPVLNSIHDSPLIRNASIFVNFFFVLSGFVISLRYMRSIDTMNEAGAFIVSRIARLWPLHGAVVFVFILIELSKSAVISFGLFSGAAWLTPDEMVTAAQQILLLQAFSNETSYLWNFPSWSISAELVAYSVFALACTLVRPVGVAFAAVCSLFAFAVGVGFVDPGFGATFGGGLFSAVAGFFIGVAVCILHKSRPLSGLTKIHPPMATLLEAGLVAVIVTWLFYRKEMPFPALVEPFLFGMTILVFAAERGLVSRLFLTPPLQGLGGLSYAVYMTHALVIGIIGLVSRVMEKLLGITIHATSDIEGLSAAFLDFGGAAINNLASLGIVCIVLWVSRLANIYIERPSIVLARQITSRSVPHQPVL